MDKNLTIKERFLLFADKQGISRSCFYEKIGVAASNFKGIGLKSKIGSEVLVKFLTEFPQVSTDWLLTGSGDMLKSDEATGKDLEATVKDNKETPSGIPLVTQSAVAGFGSSSFSISEQDVKDYYVIPKFKYNRVDFMIEVSGSSMYPKYNSGDIVACTIIKEESFIQWNKCHVIATKEQGILVKRIKKGDSEDKILAISDNKDYDPFQIPRNEITGIALVIGVIRLE